jgi:peptidoglycan/LPS O-acetylase OafA/YrhL
MRKYVAELDGLRAISVLLVISTHMHQKVWTRASGPLGVVVFFVLSGFLITSLAMQEEASTGTVSLKAFYIRRSFRIFPLYYLILAVYWILICVLAYSPEKAIRMNEALPYLLGYMQEFAHLRWDGIFPFYQSWSLGIEEKFYLVWPFLAFVALPRLRGPLAIILTLASCIIGALSSGTYYTVHAYSSILVGCCLALYQDCLPFARMRNWWTPILLVLVLFHTVLIPLSQRNPILVTIYAICVALLVGVVTHSSTAFNKFLSLPLLVWIGKLSYGIYLVHLLCLNVAERISSNPVLAYILACAISASMALVLHFTVEKPFIKIGRAWAGKRKGSQKVRPQELTAAAG